ncbi:MAG: LysR family transcriptional regulator [Sphingomonadales bacterium]
MNWAAISFDWNQVRAFLATAEEGSLSAAARALKQTQPTLSRQVTALEDALGVTLFERGTRVMRLTDAGHDLLDHVRVMGEAATKVSLAASGQSQSITGRVTVTATTMMAVHHLAPALTRIRQEAPDLQLDILPSNDVQDLTQREADIAIRHGQPSQPDLIAKQIGTIHAHLYAAKTHLDAMGRPKDLADLARFDFIGFEDRDTMMPYLDALGLPFTRASMAIVTTSGPALLSYLAAGLGISIQTEDIETLFPDVFERALPEMAPMDIPIWLATHRELKTAPRIRLVYDILADEIGQRAKTFAKPERYRNV